MKTEIWKRLVRGKSLRGLASETIVGRIDVRNLQVPEPKVAQVVQTPIAEVAMLDGVTDIERANWQSIDLSSSRLPGLRFINCNITDCVFDACRMPDLRVWGTSFTGVSFRSADLSGASLGGVDGKRRTSFRNVDFTAADMRQAYFRAAEFVGCVFKNTKLDRAD